MLPAVFAAWQSLWLAGSENPPHLTDSSGSRKDEDHGSPEIEKEGEKVGGLLRSWRELRRQNPHLFQRGVKIYGQKECTMDEQICGLLTEEDREDAAKHGASQSVC